jgi:hypothetical protein
MFIPAQNEDVFSYCSFKDVLEIFKLQIVIFTSSYILLHIL